MRSEGVTLLPYISTESRPMHDKTGATIGALAETAGVNVESDPLLPAQGPDAGAREALRQHPPVRLRRSLARVRFIKSAQRLGFSLEGSRRAAGTSKRSAHGCSEARQLAERETRGRAPESSSDLQRIESVLAGLVARCSCCSRPSQLSADRVAAGGTRSNEPTHRPRYTAVICSRSCPSSSLIVSRASRSASRCEGVRSLDRGPPAAGAGHPVSSR